MKTLAVGVNGRLALGEEALEVVQRLAEVPAGGLFVLIGPEHGREMVAAQRLAEMTGQIGEECPHFLGLEALQGASGEGDLQRAEAVHA